MSRYFEIHITNGTPICDTYTIYHTSAVPGNEVTIYPSNTPAVNITYSQLTSSPPLVIIAPDNATTILLKDTCGNCTPYIDPTPARHFYDTVIESKNLNLLSESSACDGYGNGCLVSGNGLTFCTSTQFYSDIDLPRIESYPTYLIYEGNKLLVTGIIGSSVVNVTSSDNVIAGCTPCDDRPTVFSGLVTTQKSYTFTAQASFPNNVTTTGNYNPSIFEVNPIKFEFDNVSITNGYFNYYSGNNATYSLYNLSPTYNKDFIIEYDIIFDISGMKASGTTTGCFGGQFSNDWQNDWRQYTAFYMQDMNLAPQSNGNWIGDQILIRNTGITESGFSTTVRVRMSFPYRFYKNGAPYSGLFRFTLTPRVRRFQWTNTGAPPNYQYANEFGDKGPWSNCGTKYWDKWGTLKILPGSYVKIYDASQFNI
jgi:hypothetical protein